MMTKLSISNNKKSLLCAFIYLILNIYIFDPQLIYEGRLLCQILIAEEVVAVLVEPVIVQQVLHVIPLNVQVQHLA